MKSVINLLEASLYRLNIALAKVTQSSPPTHRFSSFITESKDKQVKSCYYFFRL